MIAPLPPPVHGSAVMTQYIKDSQLINSEFSLDWVNLSTSRSMAEIGKHNPVKIFRFFGSYFKTLWKLLTNRYETCYLAITCHGKGFIKDAPFVLLCKMFGRKIIIHQHNKGMSNDVHKPFYRWLFKAVYKNTRVILLSERLYPDISSIVSPDQIEICPNGIPEVPRLPHADNAIPKLLFLSNLIASKGVYILLDACKLLKDRGLKFTCSFVGGETAEINRTKFEEEVSRRGLNELVVYEGPKYGNEKNQTIANSDVLVFPTNYINETFGLVLLEAMQQAVPQVSTPIGGIPDIIKDGETGFIAEPATDQVLADKLSQLIQDKNLRSTLGENAFKRFEELYTQKKFEESISLIIQMLSGEEIKYVDYYGPIYGKAKLKVLSCHDILVFPTMNDTFGLVAVEAMQAAMPVITTNESALPDIVKHGETGFICTKGSSTEFADAIEKLIGDTTLRLKMGKQGYLRYKKYFTIDSFEKNILNILQKYCF